MLYHYKYKALEIKVRTKNSSGILIFNRFFQWIDWLLTLLASIFCWFYLLDYKILLAFPWWFMSGSLNQEAVSVFKSGAHDVNGKFLKNLNFQGWKYISPGIWLVTSACFSLFNQLIPRLDWCWLTWDMFDLRIRVW